MGHLRELKQKRKDIIDKLIQNETLCRLIGHDLKDCLTNPQPIDGISLVNYKIIPLPFIKDITTFSGTQILVFFGAIQNNGVYFKDVPLKFVICTSKDCWTVNDIDTRVGIRPELIACEIEDMFNLESGLGVGKTLFQGYKPMQISNEIYGYELTYLFTSFN